MDIPRSVDEYLRGKFIRDFEKMSCNINPNNIEVCHCITNKNDRMIVKFTGNKDLSTSFKGNK